MQAGSLAESSWIQDLGLKVKLLKGLWENKAELFYANNIGIGKAYSYVPKI